MNSEVGEPPTRPARADGSRDPDALLTLRVLRPAAGGHCLAHAEGATVFVRGALPGELVQARVTGRARGGRVLFADVVTVTESAPDRVTPPCPAAGSCGGCDLQHVAPDAQLAWKSDVLRDQLRRIGGLSEIQGRDLGEAVAVQAVPISGQSAGLAAGLGWRTRVAADADADGAAGFHAYRSDRIVAVAGCPVLVPELQPMFDVAWPAGARVIASTGADHRHPVMVRATPPTAQVPPGWGDRGWVTRQAAGRSWRVATDGFWQAHVGAADLLVAEVLTLLAPAPGEHALDLYAGVGLFGGVLAQRVGPGGRVDLVEGDARAVRLARRNLHDLPHARIHDGEVGQWLTERGEGAEPDLANLDLVVLDPPRSGAGADVVAHLARSSARAVAYVACDGGALARDLRSFVSVGWRVAAVRAFDLFPMSAHVEAVALVVPDSAG